MTETSTRQGKDPLGLLLESVRDFAILVLDEEGRVQRWGSGAELAFGYAAAEVVGRHGSIIFTPEDIEQGVPEEEMRVARMRGRADDERWHIHKDGSRFWTIGSLTALRDEAGKLYGFVKLVQDATARRQVEEERARLLAQEQAARAEAEATALRLQQLQAVTDATLASLSLDELLDELLVRVHTLLAVDTVAILLLEGDALVARAAKGLEDEVERAVRIPFGKGFAGRVAAQRRALMLEQVNPAEIISPVLREKEIRSLLGVPLLVEDRVLGVLHVGTLVQRAFRDDDVRLLQLVADRAAMAIERAHLFEAERRARVGAEEATRVRDLVISVASHELKTPITAIQGFAELLPRSLAREGIVSPSVGRGLQAIHQQALRLSRLIDHLLDLTRIQTGQLTVNLVPLDLGALVRQFVEASQPLFAEHQIQLNLPEEAQVVRGDEARLEQVLRNLVNNAVKYSPDGGVVSLGVESRDGQICLEVSDQGIGIPANAIPHLFDPFYRAANAQSYGVGGLGLGLAVVKEIVARHGGAIEVESVQGQGATFRVCLPAGG